MKNKEKGSYWVLGCRAQATRGTPGGPGLCSIGALLPSCNDSSYRGRGHRVRLPGARVLPTLGSSPEQGRALPRARAEGLDAGPQGPPRGWLIAGPSPRGLMGRLGNPAPTRGLGA